MALLYAGIDEAGYGPTLGPLCVAMTAFELASWSPGEAAPDLWHLLGKAVCRAPRDARGRIAIADSKALKLPNDALERATPVHPLTHLERGVLSMLRTLDPPPPVACDVSLASALEARWPGEGWYAGEPCAMPLACDAARLGIDASRLAGAMQGAGVRLVGCWCVVLDELAVNEAIRRTGTKAEATAQAVGAHLRRLWSLWQQRAAQIGAGGLALRVVGDQLGGRTGYERLLARELPEAGVRPLAEGEARSRYALLPVEPMEGAPDVGVDPHRAIVQFMPEAETHHLPVALASMAAKLVRELAMARFNRYWCTRVPELKPTAGYATDARRWLRDAHVAISDEERVRLVRLA